MVVSDAGYIIRYHEYITAITLASNDYWKSIDPPTPEGKERKKSMLMERSKFSSHYTRYAYDKVKITRDGNTIVSFDRIEAATKLIGYTHQLNFVYEEGDWLPTNKVDYNQMVNYLLSNIEAEKLLQYVHSEIDFHYAYFHEKIVDEDEYRETSIVESEKEVFTPTRTKIDAQNPAYWQQHTSELIQIVSDFYEKLELYIVEMEFDMDLLALDEFFDILSPLEKYTF